MTQSKFATALEKGLNLGSATLLFFILFIIDFFIGFHFGRIPANQGELNAQQTIAWTCLLAGFIALVPALTTTVVNATAEKINSDKLEEQESENAQLAEQIKRINFKGKEKLELLRTIRDLVIASRKNVDERSLEKLRSSIETEISSFERDQGASEEIANWLNVQENKITLMQYSVTEAISYVNWDLDLHKEGLSIFKEDIFRCIEWLQSSLEEGVPRLAKASRLANAATRLPDGFINHENALHALEKHPMILEKSQGSTVFYSLIDDLIAILKREVNQSGGVSQLSFIDRQLRR